MAAKRLTKELGAYNRHPSPALSRLEPASDEDIFHLSAVLRGPEGTAYEGGRWDLSITVPQQYPNTPPEIRFQTPICHPNVNFKTGEICLDLLKTSWTPAYGIVSTLEAVQQLLSAGGEPDSPLNIDLAVLLRDGDLVGAEALVRFYTQMLAVPRP
ncbi:Ubiquitin-conjugating enzyme E2 PEX4 [Pseudocercospora fuligena]|uniref:Ubiquitin-conjugating enzyme E2 PEX4 n=1 Tax=Pseudocercospora fuligena TaxID=685502 RepID=A0A8H6VKM4_9PEZI|nr:Ubiquitin-conjugating enzyme E2 PEX4 [Pseudocercospora fuligena]